MTRVYQFSFDDIDFAEVDLNIESVEIVATPESRIWGLSQSFEFIEVNFILAKHDCAVNWKRDGF